MSVRIKTCSPGTKVEYILNDQAILCFFKANEINKFHQDDNARSLNDTGSYIGYSQQGGVRNNAYSGESTTEDSGGVLARIKEHTTANKPLTDYLVLMNSTVDGHRKLDGSTFKLFEHIFKNMLIYADKTDVINIKRTGSSVSPETYQKVICPILIDMKYALDSNLAWFLTPSSDIPLYTQTSKKFIGNDANLIQVHIQGSIILKNSHFRFPHKQIRESNDCFTLLTSLINANICIPYVWNSEIVMKFITDTDLNAAHIINSSQKKDFVINERTLVNLMGSAVDFKRSFK